MGSNPVSQGSSRMISTDQTQGQGEWSADTLVYSDDGMILLAQLGQTLDGQIATQSGQSKYINGQDGLSHLHALRAWADVVVVGVGTVEADNPRLDVRLVAGKDPDRVIIDPTLRAPCTAQCLQSTHVRRVLLAKATRVASAWPTGVEVELLGCDDHAFDPRTIRAWLNKQGWKKVLIEGGAAAGTKKPGAIAWAR